MCQYSPISRSRNHNLSPTLCHNHHGHARLRPLSRLFVAALITAYDWRHLAFISETISTEIVWDYRWRHPVLNRANEVCARTETISRLQLLASSPPCLTRSVGRHFWLEEQTARQAQSPSLVWRFTLAGGTSTPCASTDPFKLVYRDWQVLKQTDEVVAAPPYIAQCIVSFDSHPEQLFVRSSNGCPEAWPDSWSFLSLVKK